MLRVHPAADLFPMLPDNELQALASDIKANGLTSPIVVMDGGGEWLLLDGRNRARACELAGVTPSRTVFSGKDPVAFVVSANLHRRHLNSSQRAMVAEAIAKLRNGVRKTSASQICEASQADAAALLKVSKRSVESARKVKERGVPELVAAVVSGDVAVSAAAEVARLPKEEQRAVIAEGKKAVVARAKAEREKAPPCEIARWDADDFIVEVRAQLRDWRAEWLRHEPKVARLVRTIRTGADLFEKEEAETCAR